MRAHLLSFFYRLTRKTAIAFSGQSQTRHGYLPDLEDVIHWGDRSFPALDRISFGLLSRFSRSDVAPISLYEHQFLSPLTFSAFKDDYAMLDIWIRMGLGGGCLKTILRSPSPGNPRPRIQSVNVDNSEHLLNAMGLPGVGVPQFLNQLDRSGLLTKGCPIGISVGGCHVDDYYDNTRDIDAFLNQHHQDNVYFELNISCPNTPEGQQLTRHPEMLRDLLIRLRKLTNRVIGVKLSPDQSNEDIFQFSEIVASVPRTYVNLGNTRYQKCTDVGLPETAISVGGGGLSGPSLYDRTLDMVKRVAPLGIPIIATGGVRTAEQVRTLLGHGATLIGMATQLVQDPYQIPLIHRTLKEHLN